MARRLAWILPSLFLVVAVVYVFSGRFLIAGLYVALAVGLGLHSLGTLRAVAPMQWFGAGISGFVLIILLWIAFAG